MVDLADAADQPFCQFTSQLVAEPYKSFDSACRIGGFC